jgi:hypothetical protein
MSFPAGSSAISTGSLNRLLPSRLAEGYQPITYNPGSRFLQVTFGQPTFNAEGTEAAGPWFSRQIHYPGGERSGVTIGRGYDMGGRTPLQVQRELLLAGVGSKDATLLSTAAGLQGASADIFVAENREHAPIISLEAQQALFERVVTPQIISDISRILTKPDVQATYGKSEWALLKPEIKELLFDMRYRGDYTPTTRTVLQPHIVSNDTDALLKVMEQRDYWRNLGVPEARIDARIGILRLAGKS